jgi:hypothetical protein
MPIEKPRLPLEEAIKQASELGVNVTISGAGKYLMLGLPDAALADCSVVKVRREDGTVSARELERAIDWCVSPPDPADQAG